MRKSILISCLFGLILSLAHCGGGIEVGNPVETKNLQGYAEVQDPNQEQPYRFTFARSGRVAVKRGPITLEVNYTVDLYPLTLSVLAVFPDGVLSASLHFNINTLTNLDLQFNGQAIDGALSVHLDLANPNLEGDYLRLDNDCSPAGEALSISQNGDHLTLAGSFALDDSSYEGEVDALGFVEFSSPKTSCHATRVGEEFTGYCSSDLLQSPWCSFRYVKK